MKLKKTGLLVLVLIISIISCEKDDNGGTTTVEIRDRAEQQEEDIDSIQKYLKNHYFNKEEIDAIEAPKIADLDIVKVEEGETVPDGYVALKEEVDSLTGIIYEETTYKLYILKLNQGAGAAPRFADEVRVNYEGFTLEDEVFDSAINPVDLDLVGNGSTTSGVIRGWQVAFPEFNAAESFVENGDGTVTYNNHGAGVIFIPSGLAYFSGSLTGVASYSPLIFKVELFQVIETDHDGDGVPSYKENISSQDGDSYGEFTVNSEDLTDTTDDDTDGDGIPDYVDTDDDGDGVLTINEDLEDMDLEVDSDGDGDPTNDKDGDGDPTNDDTDGDGIPNYLDEDDFESN